MFRRVFSSETLFIPHNVRRPFRRKKIPTVTVPSTTFPGEKQPLAVEAHP